MMELWREYAACMRALFAAEDEADQFGAVLELANLSQKIEEKIGTDGSDDGLGCLIIQDEFTEREGSMPAGELLAWLEARVALESLGN